MDFSLSVTSHNYVFLSLRGKKAFFVCVESITLFFYLTFLLSLYAYFHFTSFFLFSSVHPTERPGRPGAQYDLCVLSHPQDQVYVLFPGSDGAGRHLQGHTGNRRGNGAYMQKPSDPLLNIV